MLKIQSLSYLNVKRIITLVLQKATTIPFIAGSALGYLAIFDSAILAQPNCVSNNAETFECSQFYSTDKASFDLAESEQESQVVSENFSFELQGCQRSGDNVLCSLSIVNIADSDRFFGLFANHNRTSRIIDVSGNEYISPWCQLGSQQGNYAVTTLIRDVPIKGIFTFANVPEEVNELAVLDLHYFIGDSPNFSEFHNVQFRDISIQPE